MTDIAIVKYNPSQFFNQSLTRLNVRSHKKATRREWCGFLVYQNTVGVTRGWINLINNNEKKTRHPVVQKAVHDSIYDFVLFPGQTIPFFQQITDVKMNIFMKLIK